MHAIGGPGPHIFITWLPGKKNEGCNNGVQKLPASTLQLTPAMGEGHDSGTGWGLPQTWLPLYIARQLQREAHSSSTATSDSALGIAEL
jgi:hypothetical protein